jgi:hypothetical protein
MSWEGQPNFRWVKMYKGVRYRVTCDELGAMMYTQEDSAKLANQWWKRKQAEIDGPSALGRILNAVEETPIEKLREITARGDAVRQILAELPFVKQQIAKEEIERIIGEPIENDTQAIEKLGRLVSHVAEPASSPAQTFRHHTDRFLALTHGECGAMSYREIKEFINTLYGGGVITPDMDIKQLNEAKIEAVFLWLKELPYFAPTKKKRWGFFKRLVRYCWEARAIELPRNLESRAFRFKVQPKAIKTFTGAEVRECLNLLKPQLRLYAMLGLNCGMTNVDIGLLRKDQISNGRLTRKRVKTMHHDLVPTVSYPLWPETQRLLKECISDHPELALTSSDGTSLYSSRFEAGGTRKKDLLSKAWRVADVEIPLKAFRSIGATLLESHETYGRYKSHFLGHSPKTIADRHYAAPSQELFDRAINWLRRQIF